MKFSAGLTEHAHDPRIDELRTMGISAYWIRVAESVGVDAFLRVWRILDAEPSIDRDDGVMKVPLRSYRAYLRYQRNRYIESLHDSGVPVPEIQKRVRRELCERISVRHIFRIVGDN